MRKVNAYNQILNILHELHKDYPNYNIGRHISTAFDGYGDLWGVTDKELLFALEKYKTQLQMDVKHSDSDLQRIINDGLDLDNILKEETDGEY